MMSPSCSCTLVDSAIAGARPKPSKVFGSTSMILLAPFWSMTIGGGWPALVRVSVFVLNSISRIRSVPDGPNDSQLISASSRCRTVDTGKPHNTRVRKVWRNAAEYEAASVPCPTTSPTTMI